MVIIFAYMKRKIFREDILNAGKKLMFLNGYEATGIKSITDEVGIPKGSFYNHFENKEVFGLEMLGEYCNGGIQMHRRNLLESSKNPMQRLEDHYDGMIASLIQQSEYKLGCIMGNFSMEMADVNESFRKILDDKFEEIQEIIFECLKEGQEKKVVNMGLDPLMMSGFMLNSWHGALIRMKATATAKPLNDFREMIFTQLAP
ncbi:MAG: hypothetical protein BM563_11760 [Bacteroidetes bacterium MedPE-SWsnd-G1]|nr:MAG: hypothetical protein BM563_11760 [Bacteroidetes bacterium MedPE-SWsnd-G1]